MMLSEKQKKIGVLILAVTAAYAGYRLVTRQERSPIAAIKSSVVVPIKAAAELPKKALHLVKGSPEAKAHMAALRQKSGGHKGHKTKRGLRQDQVMVSKEAWEKTYRKKKREA